MRNRSYKHYIRKAHRYLGIFIGVQFLAWTVGGIFFSWTNIEEVRSEHLRSKPHPVEPSSEMFVKRFSPSDHLPQGATADLTKLRFVGVLGEAHFSLPYTAVDGEEKVILVRLKDGESRPPATEENAKEIARSALTVNLPITKVALIGPDQISGHHEYRKKPLPAYAISFSGRENLTVYVSKADWQVQAVRSDTWRAFDLLWMLHTMDFAGRDDFNNYLIRTVSVLGILTLLSGFALFVVSSKNTRRLLRVLGW